MKQNECRHCPACRQGVLRPSTWTREFRPHGHSVKVELLTSVCSHCGTKVTTEAQHDENLRLLNARKDCYDGLLLGEEILALRRRYGITQRAAAKLFGKGKIAFSRYEHETSYPDLTTTRILQLAIEKPAVVRWLADRAGVELPLWDARCADERDQKLRVIADVHEDSARANAWLRIRPPAGDQVALRAWKRGEHSQSQFEVATNDDVYVAQECYA